MLAMFSRAGDDGRAAQVFYPGGVGVEARDRSNDQKSLTVNAASQVALNASR